MKKFNINDLESLLSKFDEKEYRGKLDIKQATEVIETVKKNSLSLYEDATLLFENKRFSRAIALGILSIEESSKPSIIREILLCELESDIKKKWKNFRSHRYKNKMWLLPKLMDNRINLNQSSNIISNHESHHTKHLDILKQKCFYTDIYEGIEISDPLYFNKESLAKEILRIAKLSINSINENEQFLEIWVRHYKEIIKLNQSESLIKTIECFEELYNNKLIPRQILDSLKYYIKYESKK